jgi:hypothetical protein
VKRCAAVLIAGIMALVGVIALTPVAKAAAQVSWTAPTDGATVFGTFDEKKANGRVAVTPTPTRVDFYVDGRFSNTERYAPWSLVWDSRTVPDGRHVLRATATFPDSTTQSAAITVNVDNVTSPAGGWPSITESQADRDGDFDSGCQLVGSLDGAWNRSVVGTDYPGKAELVRDRVVQGSCAMRTTQVASNLSIGRSELAWNQGAPGAEGVYEFAIYVPSSAGFYSSTKDIDVTQHKQSGAGSSCYSGGLGLSPTGFSITAVHACDGSGGETETEYPLGTWPRDRWWAIRVHFRWSNSGYLQVEVDPDGPGPAGYETRLPRTPTDTVQDSGIGVKVRLGQYGRMTTGSQLWFDGYRMSCVGSC